ncbi:aspergillopepsin-2 [Drepanopeziza brunnea f. sp. 'multigermtubi' MB_m1]|uniref:Aspergillopepsin-2 n=2 Tax=Drepanopeziza brunnea f. sp. 'multigermtubi' TaxID=698441 RepID=K1WBU0_MARBU|nr:aspergillopepsin-2 [Drepanopeziza brunnea f. sp. 'multigermtubi' MB_m1]EKD14840.1 aspergillopepsin-2 [Drepanopeziza brunnea f. sp. 'multigermtubi' MB_m1]
MAVHATAHESCRLEPPAAVKALALDHTVSIMETLISRPKPGRPQRSYKQVTFVTILRSLPSTAGSNLAKMKPDHFLTAVSLGSACTAQSTPYVPFYSSEWGGPVQLAENFNSSSNTSAFNLVEATLVMPHLSIPQNPRARVDRYTVASWIGLDGFPRSDGGGPRGLWQAGVFMSIWENGTTEYSGFYEWVPSDPVFLTASQLAICEGDHIRVMINTTDAGYCGTTTLTNLNTSQTFAYSQAAPTAWRGPTFPAPGSSAEWIMEAAAYLNTTKFVLPDWGNASMLDARACYVSGDCVVPGDIDKPEDTRMAVVLWNETQTVNTQSTVDGSSVSIAYVELPFSSQLGQ